MNQQHCLHQTCYQRRSSYMFFDFCSYSNIKYQVEKLEVKFKLRIPLEPRVESEVNKNCGQILLISPWLLMISFGHCNLGLDFPIVSKLSSIQWIVKKRWLHWYQGFWPFRKSGKSENLRQPRKVWECCR